VSDFGSDIGSDTVSNAGFQSQSQAQLSPPAAAARSGRRVIVLVMITSLLFSAGARYWADAKRDVAIPHRGSDIAATSLGSMDSFALGLLLGGLRGPLVMILWTESETQKSDKNLEGVDTQIEWIRLLQPEFDTVHIFEIWNKAYNISVQMASLANKYDVILGALDYAYNVDRAKPDDINIVAAIGQLYFDKLGTSSEKVYYRRRVRQETLPHPSNQKARQQDPGWRRVQLDPVLDNSFNILPALTKPVKGHERPANLPASQEWDDGAALPYLPAFAPYPDGVSPYGLAYNYYKRAEVLQNVGMQRHDQLSDLVIDSRPALSLKFWGEEEMEQGHRRELQAFGIPMPENVDDMLAMTAGLPLAESPKDPAAFKLAIVAFSRAEKLFPKSLEEYNRHILHFPERELQYQSYMEEIRAEVQLAGGDTEYLEAMICPPAERAQHLAAALKDYRECGHLSYINLLRYYIDSDILPLALPPGFGLDRIGDHKPVEDLSPEQAQDAVLKADAIKRTKKNQYINSDRFEFDRFIARGMAREKSILAAQAAHN
jgi:hypothetical protein